MTDPSGESKWKFSPDQAYAMRAQAGDTTAIASLLARYRGLVRQRAMSMRVAGMECDDLTQEGLIGLLQAIRSYDPDRDTRFHTYAMTCIQNRMLSAVRQAGRRKHQPLNSYLSLYEEDVENLDWMDGGGNPESLVIRREEAEDLYRKIIDCLSVFEKKVFTLYLSGCGYDVMAARLDTTHKAVDNALQRIRRKFKSMNPNPAGGGA